jgi:hypothetical protein
LACVEAGVARQFVQMLAPKHGDESGELRFEGSESIRPIHSRNIEVERERTGCDAESNSTRMPSVEPGDLLGDERGGP